ncbi:CPBP family intramembrane glutamic endopeptidase [Natrononativus amylolyticus]|uniref:CPBP family intramembrane glutamic endopeptidase n=1 Tax=Natrononativus amylolyticus TaxID=2963434 RepID=UPI0020CD82AB|nr:CPBP family intramembrane glutamic endopeptidase [Natrononativus amylolyticus]
MNTKHLPTNERLSTMERWKATTLCGALLFLVLPLVVLPGTIASRLSAIHSLSGPIDTALIGIALSLCVFVGLGRILGLPLSDVFIRRPTAATLRWLLFGVSLAVFVLAVPLAVVDGTLTLEFGGGTRVLWAVTVALALATWAAILEELLLRGYLLSILGHQWGWPTAIVVTSVVFGLLHNGHASETVGTVLYVGTATLAGVLFALVTYYTGNVWNAVGIHAAWNTLLSPELVAFRADEAARDTLLTYVPAAQPVLFGGEFSGVTESPFTMGVLAVGTAGVLGYYRRWSA